VAEARKYLAANVPVGPRLCDQLLLPLALTGGGAFVTSPPTEHTRSNIAVIEAFLAVKIVLADLGAHRWRVSVAS
ncbi:RNA 3'-terminal phosphate cyclase, partial [Herbaspirillum sp. HC18]